MSEGQSESISERYQKAVGQIESSPEQAVDVLSKLQHEVAVKAFFSVENESIDDISTSSMPLLMLEHYLAMAYTKLPTNGIEGIEIRQHNLRRACDLWASFLQNLDALEQLSKEEQTQYQNLLEIFSDIENGNDDDDNNNNSSSSDIAMPPPANRDAKIARFRAKQAAENERQRLESLRERRRRLGISPQDELDGHDQEGLDRTLELTSLQIAKNEAIEEWSSTLRELPMIAMLVKSKQEQQGHERYKGQRSGDSSITDSRQQQQSKGPLKVTHITQDSVTGRLQFQRQEIRANVLRPGWNQPTMSLQEFGEREMQAALEREARQKESEAAAKTQPRRYDQLRKDGLEDNADLVDASADLDRKWDDFKDENPRGSGNKRGDVGDRNF